MSYNLPQLNWIRAFESSARHLSFTAAAKELHRTQTSISQQVRSLERHIGFQLFERLPHGLRLSDMGLAYLPAVRKTFEDLSVATAGLFGPVSDRPVIVRAPVSTAVLWLAPRLNVFSELYPDIDIRLYSALWADSLSADETDIDIRMGDGNWPGFTVALLGSETAIPVCSAQTLKTFGSFDHVSELAQRDLIHIMGFEDLWMRVLSTQDQPASTFENHGITVDTTLAAIELVAAGQGFAMIQKSLAQLPLRENKVVQAMDVEIDLPHAHYMTLPHSDKQTRSEVLLFRDWVVNAFRSDACPGE